MVDINILKKVRELIKIYDFKISEEWLETRTELELSNLMKLPLNLKEYFIDTNLLIDRSFLNSEYYISDIDMLVKYFSYAYSNSNFENNDLIKQKTNILFDFVQDDVSKGHEYHLMDMKTLINCESLYKLNLIYNIATCENSLNSNFHTFDINLINKATEKDIASKLAELASNKLSLNSKYHSSDMALIYKSTNEIIAEYLLLVGKNRLSLNSPYHENDMNLIANCKDTDIADLLVEVATNEISLNSLYHESDMKIISEATDLDIADILVEMATNEITLKSIYHESDMTLISKIKDVEIAKLMYVYATNKKHIKDKDHNLYMELCSKANSDYEQYINMLLITYLQNSKVTLNNVFDEVSNKHKRILEYISALILRKKSNIDPVSKTDAEISKLILELLISTKDYKPSTYKLRKYIMILKKAKNIDYARALQKIIMYDLKSKKHYFNYDINLINNAPNEKTALALAAVAIEYNEYKFDDYKKLMEEVYNDINKIPDKKKILSIEDITALIDNN